MKPALSLILCTVTCLSIASPCASQDTVTGLVAHWPLDGSCGDATGNGNNCTVPTNGPTVVSGAIGQAYVFDGINDELPIQATAALKAVTGGPYSMSTWVFLAETPAVAKFVLDALDSRSGAYLGDQRGLRFQSSSAPMFKWVTNLPTNTSCSPFNPYSSCVTSPQEISLNEWHHLVGVFDGTQGQIYVDGALVNNVPSSGTSTPTDVWKIGNVSGGGTGTGWFKGRIDDVRVYGRALTSADVQELFFEGAPSSLTDRERVCRAFADLGDAVHTYQEASIDVFARADVGFARSVAKSSDKKEALWAFAGDFLASGDAAYIAGKMAYKGLGSQTGQWISKKMVPRLRDKMITQGLRWLNSYAVDWFANAEGSIEWPWSDFRIEDYIKRYLHQPDTLGSLHDQTLLVPGETCAGMPTQLASDYPIDAVVRELRSLEARVRQLKPIPGVSKEGDAFWAIPEMCSFGSYQDLDPVLLGATSVETEHLRFVSDFVDVRDVITAKRREGCATWVLSGGIPKVFVSVTGLGAPPAEALYWGGVGVCNVASTVNTALNLFTDGWAYWSQFEALASLQSDVLLSKDFLTAVGNAVHAPATSGCSTQVKAGSLSIPDVTGGWLAGYAKATGTLPLTNNGNTFGLARVLLNVYKAQGPTYNELVLRTPTTDGDKLILPLMSANATFEFEVPDLFTDRYFAQARVIGSSGNTTRWTAFRACHPARCFLEDTWNEIMSGTLSQGESQKQVVTASGKAVEAEFVLGYGGSDFDLHVYDSTGRHVGIDYDTGEVELGIPGARYSGKDTLPEVVAVPLNADRQFTAKVVAVEAEVPEDFSVMLTDVSAHPATLAAMPEQVEATGDAGTTVGWVLGLAEIGRQHDATGLHVVASDFVGPGGTIPGSALAAYPVPDVIAAGTQTAVHVSLPLPGAAHGVYAGSISISSNAGSSIIPVRIEIPNSPPQASAGPDQLLECSSPIGTLVTLDGSGSSDPDQDPLTFEWRDSAGSLIGTTAKVEVRVPLGVSQFTLIVNDNRGTTSSAAVKVTSRDATAPAIQIDLAPAMLWPPNHVLVPVTATIAVTDSCDGSPRVRLLSLASSEPDNGLGDGDTRYDIQGAATGTDDRQFLLRAERSGKGPGRLYTATYEATDQSGNATRTSAVVRVPLDE